MFRTVHLPGFCQNSTKNSMDYELYASCLLQYFDNYFFKTNHKLSFKYIDIVNFN